MIRSGGIAKWRVLMHPQPRYSEGVIIASFVGRTAIETSLCGLLLSSDIASHAACGAEQVLACSAAIRWSLAYTCCLVLMGCFWGSLRSSFFGFALTFASAPALCCVRFPNYTTDSRYCPLSTKQCARPYNFLGALWKGY
jgi:hypothetical protein